MSPSRSSRSSHEDRDPLDSGFTLIEVLVALTVLALVAMGSLPLLIAAARAGTASKLNTQAKNAAEQVMEQMRDLQFHVDRQNGPFVDLLDQYYTDCRPFATLATPVTTTTGTETARGFVASGPSAGEPVTGPFYRRTSQVRVDNVTFTQVVATQFLTNTPARAHLSVARFCPTTVPAAGTYPAGNYNSQIIGQDKAPSTLVGVTVLLSWTVDGRTKTSRTYTEIADQRTSTSLVTAEAHASALRVSSTAYDGAALLAEVGVADALGALSTGSNASVHTQGGYAKHTTALAVATEWNSAPADAAAPPNPTTAPAATSGQLAGWNALLPDVGLPVPGAYGTCGFSSLGKNRTGYADASTGSGLPAVPSNAGTVGWSPAVAAVTASGSPTACGAFGFTNQVPGAPALAQPLTAPATKIVHLPDTGGNADLLSGAAGLYATPEDTSGVGVVAARARVLSATSGTDGYVQLFPGVSGVTDGRGLVNVRLLSAQLDCTNGNTATGAYTVNLDYWRSGMTRGTVTATFASGTAFTDPLAALPLASIQVGGGRTLADFFSAWSMLTAVAEGNNGVHAMNGIVSLVTTPTRAGDATSAVQVDFGRLSCVADDNR